MLRWSRINRLKKNSSFKHGLFLVIILVAIWFIAGSVQRSGMPALLAAFLHPDLENFRNLEQFEEDKATEIQKSFAGFWVYAEGDPKTSPVVKREFLEIIDNGIIWMVKVWDMKMPDGETSVVKHVINAYTKPFSYNPDNSAYHCETRVIRQIYIADGDTCYGASHADEIWVMAKSKDGGRLTVDRREYTRYEGELENFFPDNDALDEIERISMQNCRMSVDMPHFAKRLLALSMNPVPLFIRAQTIESIIHNHYKPIVFDELVRRYDPRAVPDEISMRITITPEGTVSNLRYNRAKIDTKRFDDITEMDIKSWLFPPLDDNAREPQTFDFVIKTHKSVP